MDTRGPLNVPVEEQLYHTLADEAEKARVSLYTLVTQKLSKATALQTDNITQVATNTISKSLYRINRNVHPDPVGAVS